VLVNARAIESVLHAAGFEIDAWCPVPAENSRYLFESSAGLAGAAGHSSDYNPELVEAAIGQAIADGFASKPWCEELVLLASKR
jgi:hypothetical protein